MKNAFLIVALVVSSLSVFSQKVAVTSVYGIKVGQSEDDPTRHLTKYLDEDKVAHEIIQERWDDINVGLSELFTVLPGDYLDKPFYTTALDDFEDAPGDLEFDLIDVNLTDAVSYRLTQYQVVLYDDYLAIGTAQPFNNDPAIESIAEGISGEDALMFLVFTPSVGFAGSPYGVGTCTARISLNVKLFDARAKKMFSQNVSGKSESKIALNMDSFDKEEVSVAFNEAVDDLIASMGKLQKKVSKIKW